MMLQESTGSRLSSSRTVRVDGFEENTVVLFSSLFNTAAITIKIAAHDVMNTPMRLKKLICSAP